MTSNCGGNEKRIQTQVEQSVEMLVNSVGDLGEAWSDLEKRLNEVVVREQLTKATCDGEGPAEKWVPLAESIRKESWLVNDFARRIRTVLEGLEL